MTRGEKLTIWLTVSVILSLSGWAKAAEPNDWMVVALTDNTYDDKNPQVSGSSVVWEGAVDKKDTEILLYDGVNTFQLTDNTFLDDYAGVSGSNVIWWSSYQIMLDDGVSVRQISDSALSNDSAQIHGSNVVWEGYNGNYEIYLYNIDTNETTQLTDNTGGDYSPYLSDSYVVWYGYDGDYEIYLYDIATGVTTKVTDNSYEDRDARVSDEYVVWLGRASGNYDVFMYEIATGVTTQLTSSYYDEWGCRVDGSNMVWYGLDGWDYEIYLYKAETDETLVLSDNTTDDYGPEISGPRVVWYGSDGKDYEIYMYDMEADQMYQLSNNTYNDYMAQISGRNVAWHGQSGRDWEVYYAGAKADIEVSFLSHDFGELDVGTSAAVSLNISNVGSFPLTITDVALVGSEDFNTPEMELPLVLKGGMSVDVTLTYTPSAAGDVNGVLEILSDDEDEGLIEVQMTGTGLEQASGPEEQMDELLEFFNAAVDDGTLTGTGYGRIAKIRLRVFQYMLLRADYLMDKGCTRAGCRMLREAYVRVDGFWWPRDYVKGEASGELATRIQELMVNLNCEDYKGWPYYKYHHKMMKHNKNKCMGQPYKCHR